MEQGSYMEAGIGPYQSVIGAFACPQGVGFSCSVLRVNWMVVLSLDCKRRILTSCGSQDKRVRFKVGSSNSLG